MFRNFQFRQTPYKDRENLEFPCLSQITAPFRGNESYDYNGLLLEFR
jgi:hypothetical protein